MKRMKSLAYVTALSTVVLALGVDANAALTIKDAPKASVTLHVKANLSMSFDASTSAVTVKETGAAGKEVVRINVDLSTLDSKNETRDKHMKGEKGFEIDKGEKFKIATFAVLRSALKFPEKGAKLEGQEVEGTFLLHGVGKSFKAKYDVANDGGTYKVTTKGLVIDMTKHDIPQPSYMKVTVEKEVPVDVTFALEDKS